MRGHPAVPLPKHIHNFIGIIEFERAKLIDGLLVPYDVCPHASVALARIKLITEQYDLLGLVRNVGKSASRSSCSLYAYI